MTDLLLPFIYDKRVRCTEIMPTIGKNRMKVLSLEKIDVLQTRDSNINRAIYEMPKGFLLCRSKRMP